MNAFESLLEAIGDENDRKSLQSLGEKYKEVKDGYLRQSEFSRSMNELAADKKKFDSEKQRIDAELSKLEQWKNWSRENWDEEARMTKVEKARLEKIEQLNSELEVLKTAQEAGMTFEEVTSYLDNEVAKRKLVTEDKFSDLKKSLIDKDFYEKDVLTRVGGVANGMEYLYDSTLPLVLSHKDEFNEVIKPSEIIKFANENGFKDISKAYDTMVGARRSEVLKQKNDAALAAAREEGRKEALKEKGMGTNGQVPVDNGPPVMGHLERKLRMPKDQQDSEPIDMPLGSGAMAVAARFRKDKAEGKVITEVA